MTVVIPALLAVLVFACTSAPQVASTDSSALPAPPKTNEPDSLVRDSVVYRGKAAVRDGSQGSELLLTVQVRNLRRQQVLIESEATSCNPPLYLTDTLRKRQRRWSDVAWRARNNETACVGTGLLVSLGPYSIGALEPREYPVKAIRGDSLAAGWYDIKIGAVILELDERSVSRADTIQVPAGRVWLP